MKRFTSRFLDQRFRVNKKRYIAQCFLAMLAVLVTLFLLSIKDNVALVASLGASAFIVFVSPHKRSARARYCDGGYVMGVISGIVCYAISTLPFWPDLVMLSHIRFPLFGALAVGLAIFLMVIFNLEHPPASGVALGLVLNSCEIRPMLIALGGIIMLSLLRRLMRPFLIDLL